MILKIDQEFKNLIPPLTHEERELLEKNIVKEGCRDPIVIWNSIILDGHNRYDICNSHDLEFKTVEVQLKNHNEAINWIIDNQLGKRNISHQIRMYLIGKRYQNEKKTIGGDRKSEQYKEKSGVQNQPLIKSSDVIAEQNKISSDTVKRAESFANSIDKIAENSGKSATTILKDSKITQEDAKKVESLSPETQKEIVDKVTSGESKSFKDALKPIIETERKEKMMQSELKEDFPDGCGIFIPRKSEIIICPPDVYGYCDINEKWYTEEQYNQLRD